MNRTLLSILFSFALATAVAQTSHTILATGLNYSPDSLVVTVGDTINFAVGGSHPTLEVDQSTWNNNGTTPKNNGFDYPNGTGSFVVSSAQTYYYVCTNHIGSGMKGKIIAQAMSQEEQTLEEWSVYPNPVQNRLNVELQNPNAIESMHIIDMQGRKLRDVEAGNTRDIDVSSLQDGMYILLIKQGNTAKRMRFIKR